jgi:AcrR family transcriptional regulator
MSDQGQRTWAGTTLDDRQATRRDQLIEAGFALMGEHGAGAVTVRGVTRAAKLSERYFYESFEDRDELLLAVHDRVGEQARAAITEAVTAAAASTVARGTTGDPGARTDPEAVAVAGLSAFTDFLEEDPRRGRVLLQEAFANETLVRHGVEVVPTFAALLVEQISASFEGPDETDAALSAVALVGALSHLYLGWLDGTLQVTRERLVRHATQLIVEAAGVHSGD